MAALDYEDLQGLIDEQAFAGRFDAHELGAPTLPVPPTVGSLLPAAESALAPSSTITLNVTAPLNPVSGAAGLLAVRIVATFDGSGKKETIWDGAAFGSRYSSSSRSAITNGYSFSLLRASGWPAGVTLQIDAFDSSGQLTSVTRHFTSAGNAPSVTNVSPPAGSPIGATQALSFSLVTPDAFGDVIVWARFSGLGRSEVIYDGSSFLDAYSGSTKTANGTGFDFVVKRTGGWPASPQLVVKGIDTSGQETP